MMPLSSLQNGHMSQVAVLNMSQIILPIHFPSRLSPINSTAVLNFRYEIPSDFKTVAKFF